MNKTVPVKVTLSNGIEVEVFPVPGFVVAALMARYPEPEVPKRKVNPEAAIPGITDDQLVPDPENPDYLDAKIAWNKKRIEAWTDARLVYGLKNVKVPADWPSTEDKEQWDFLGVEFNIPDNPVGKRLMYIKLSLLSAGQDLDLVFAIIDSYSDTDKDEVKATIDSFRHNS